MHKLIIRVVCIILASIAGCSLAEAQIIRDGKTFVTQQKSSSTSDVSTEYTWKDNKGNEYSIFLHKYTKGDNEGKWGAYVFKTSQKTGKIYKYYIPDSLEIAEVIAKELKL